MSEVLSGSNDNFEEIVSGITPSWEKEDAIIGRRTPENGIGGRGGNCSS